jgi:hypothetical protein
MRKCLWIIMSAACAFGQSLPDFSGVWRLDFGPFFFNARAVVDPGEALPWAEQLRDQRIEDFQKDRWTIRCLPGGPALGLDRQIAKIVQSRELIVILYEDLTYRQIFLDGRTPPSDPNPSWMGHSFGRWEGETLVVESLGFNDRTWLDYSGTPHTEALRIVERYRKSDANRIELMVIYTDDGAYSKPWTISLSLRRAPGAELIEYVCGENEKDEKHLTGKVSDGAIHLLPTTLARYVGTYRALGMGAIRVELEGDSLVMDFLGKSHLFPRTESTFVSGRGPIRFELDERGSVSRIVIDSIEFAIVAERDR